MRLAENLSVISHLQEIELLTVFDDGFQFRHLYIEISSHEFLADSVIGGEEVFAPCQCLEHIAPHGISCVAVFAPQCSYLDVIAHIAVVAEIICAVLIRFGHNVEFYIVATIDLRSFSFFEFQSKLRIVHCL